jgi:hypothetical protein
VWNWSPPVDDVVQALSEQIPLRVTGRREVWQAVHRMRAILARAEETSPRAGTSSLTCADQPVESRHMIVAFTLVRAVPRQQGRYHYGPPWPATIRLDRMTMDRAPSGS